MLCLIKTGDTTKLAELSLKQREMVMAYREDRARYLDERVTWREFIKEPMSRVRSYRHEA